MPREITTDFSKFLKFIEEYNLSTHNTNKDYIKVLSQQHKKFYSFLTCIAEIQHLRKDTSLTPVICDKQIGFLTESCSDVGSAFFVMTHGAYKASKIMLRSSIETFCKAYNLDSIPNIDKEKSVYAIFDGIKALPFFEAEPQKSLLKIIHQEYKNLCLDTHTADDINMQHITALNYFPTFDKAEATKVSEKLTLLVSAYISLLCIKYNAYFQKMHHKSKENIIDSIPRTIRPVIHGIA